MHPPFTTVDHRVDSFLPFEERRVLRRSSPERLSFPVPGPAFLPAELERAPRPLTAPNGLRVRLGEALMALGQRLAGVRVPS